MGAATGWVFRMQKARILRSIPHTAAAHRYNGSLDENLRIIFGGVVAGHCWCRR